MKLSFEEDCWKINMDIVKLASFSNAMSSAFDSVRQCNVFTIYYVTVYLRQVSSEVLTRVAVVFICAGPVLFTPFSTG